MRGNAFSGNRTAARILTQPARPLSHDRRAALVTATASALDPVGSAKAAGLRYTTDTKPASGVTAAGATSPTSTLTDARSARRRSSARIKALVIPPAWTDVWICPDPRGHLQATGRDARGRKQYRYHPKWREVRDETKYHRMIGFAQALPVIRRRTSDDLRRQGLPREKVLATVVQLLEKTLIRVGNDEYARSNRSYGLTTMRDTHVEFKGERVRFSFRGKSGVEHEIDLNDRRLARIVKQCRDLPGYELFQYHDENGERQTVGSEDVNAYLKEITGQDLTSKDFRTWAGTVLAAQLLREFEAVHVARAGEEEHRRARSSRWRSSWATPRRSAASATSTRRSSTPTSTARCCETIAQRARKVSRAVDRLTAMEALGARAAAAAAAARRNGKARRASAPRRCGCRRSCLRCGSAVRRRSGAPRAGAGVDSVRVERQPAGVDAAVGDARGDRRPARRAGSRSLMPPLVHSSLTPPSATRVRSTSTPPLVVVASIGPPTSRPTMPPLVVSALMRPVQPGDLDAAVDRRELARRPPAGTLTV